MFEYIHIWRSVGLRVQVQCKIDYRMKILFRVYEIEKKFDMIGWWLSCYMPWSLIIFRTMRGACQHVRSHFCVICSASYMFTTDFSAAFRSSDLRSLPWNGNGVEILLRLDRATGAHPWKLDGRAGDQFSHTRCLKLASYQIRQLKVRQPVMRADSPKSLSTRDMEDSPFFSVHHKEDKTIVTDSIPRAIFNSKKYYTM